MELSTADELTGLANRRRFDEVLASEWLRATRPQAPVGAIMLDIDEFKMYNDHYGHQAGDICLQRVAAAVRDTLRQGSDLLARYGGEEFAIVLPGANLAAAQRVAERARAAIEALSKPHEASRFGIVTISVGIAVLTPSSDRVPEQLFAHADAAFYMKPSAKGAIKLSPTMQIFTTLGTQHNLIAMHCTLKSRWCIRFSSNC